MNILLKSFDGSPCDKLSLEKAFEGRKIQTCISILNEKTLMPKLDVQEHLWISAADQRAGRYTDIDWNTITPLDRELMESMRQSEAVFMTMIERYAKTKDIPYNERKRQYFAHLRYWNHMLETKKIDLFLLFHIPHQCYDIVIYDLCKLKGIRTLMLDRTVSFDALYVIEDWKEPSVELDEKFAELRKEFADPNKPVPLSEKYENCFTALAKRDEEPWYIKGITNPLARTSFIHKWSGAALKMLVRKPGKFFSRFLSPTCWASRLRAHRIMEFYNKNAKVPDLSKPYIYVPLHMQPEASTCPVAGAFTDQERIVELLAWHLPPTISLYVKEHPYQGEVMRSKAFYQSLLAIPSVSFVPKNIDTFSLEKNAVAVATATGTAGLEALFHGIPVLMFGHRFFQNAPGVYLIRSTDDCKRALESILKKDNLPSLRDMRIYVRAVQETGVPYAGGPLGPSEHTTLEEKAMLTGIKLAEVLQKLFPIPQ